MAIIFTSNENLQYYWNLLLSSFVPFVLQKSHGANLEKDRQSARQDTSMPVQVRWSRIDLESIIFAMIVLFLQKIVFYLLKDSIIVANIVLYLQRNNICKVSIMFAKLVLFSAT